MEMSGPTRVSIIGTTKIIGLSTCCVMETTMGFNAKLGDGSTIPLPERDDEVINKKSDNLRLDKKNHRR